MKENIILSKSFDFSIHIIELYKVLISSNEFVIARQLLKCSTSIGANIQEATAAQSRKDFISKMSIASKEARESRYWLNLLNKSQLVPLEYDKYLIEVEGIIKIITKIVKTSQRNLHQ